MKQIYRAWDEHGTGEMTVEECLDHELASRLEKLNALNDGFVYYGDREWVEPSVFGVIHKFGPARAWVKNRDYSAVRLWNSWAEICEYCDTFRHIKVYPCQYHDHDAHVKAVPGEILERRLSHGYVGSWKHLDQHEYVGRLWIQATSTLGDEVDPEDACEPRTTTLFVKVFSGLDEKLVEGALRDHFTSWGCSHEYDCCGCRSYRAGTISRLGNGYWRVVQHSSRNY